jgi:hypothetical protein
MQNTHRLVRPGTHRHSRADIIGPDFRHTNANGVR